MKKHFIYFFSIFFFAAIPDVFGQELGKEPNLQSELTLTPGGIFDKVFDNEGRSYQLSELVTKPTSGDSGPAKSLLLCTSGYFNLYFETGSGMEDINNSTHNLRRDVLCQVFADISQFINSPLTASGQKVNIWVRDLQATLPGAASSQVAATASPFYCLPLNNPNGFGGIADNQIWKTILSGTDAYTNVYYPILNQGTSFYHGKVAVNFYNTTLNWNTDMTAAAAQPGYLDLYSILLHEVTHALGFVSLIDSDGTSVFPAGYEYYSRYDRFLKNHAGTQSLITNSGSCSLYDFELNPALTTASFVPGGCVLASGSSNSTNCSTNAIYQGTSTVPVYTPNCYEAGSTLSHFEDMCYLNNGVPYGNDLHFVLSNSSGTGPVYTKRYLQPEERNVLCDLGYSVNGTFGNAVNHNDHDYNTSACSGNNVVGFNDGISGAAYQFAGFSGINIPISGILSNDLNTNSFECLMDLTDPAASFSATTGNNSTVVNFSSTVLGIHLLRYIPVSSNGQRGNITYIYVSVSNPNCASDLCNMLNNGDFEAYTVCSASNVSLPAGCWQAYYVSAYIFDRNCTQPSTPVQLDIPTVQSVPPADSYNGTPNDNFVGLMGISSNSYGHSIQNLLSSPLVAGNSYTISFQARVGNDNNHDGVPTYLNHLSQLTFAGSQSTLPITPSSFSTLPASMTGFGDVAILNDNQWHPYTLTFVYAPNNPSAPNLQNLIVLNSTHFLGSGQDIIFADDFQLMPTDVTFDAPQTLCMNQTISNLGTYLSNFPSGGTFSGNGVSFSGGYYAFDPSVAGVGTHSISFTYLNSVGCPITLSDNITVVSSTITVTAQASPTTVCSGGSVTLSATGAGSYTWQPGNFSGSSVNVNPSAATQYTVTGTSNGCVATATVNVTTTPITVGLVPSINNICPGQQVTLTPSGASTYVLSYNGTSQNSSGSPFIVNPAATTVYNLVGTASNGCTGSTQVVVNTIVCDVCTSCVNTYGLSGLASTSTPPAVALEYCINNNVTIDANVTFTRNMVKIAPDVQITVASGYTLTITGSHLYACDEMWKGIVVESGGRVVVQPYVDQAGTITKTTLIEDAVTAIDFLPVTTQQSTALLTVNHATFNRNKVAIQVQGYPYTNVNSMFSIQRSLFTSRTIFNPSTPTTWPLTSSVKASNGTTNPLAPPCIVAGTYPSANLKAPYSSQLANMALKFTNTGFSTLTTPPTYSILTIGGTAQNSTDYNLYDNIGNPVDLTNSNIKMVNSIFQQYQIGTALNAVSNNGNRHTLVVGGVSTETCKFFDAAWAIKATDYNDVAIINNTIRSQQTYSSSNLNFNHIGKYGIYLSLSKFATMNIYTNTIYNIEKAIYVGVNSANAHTNTNNNISIYNNVVRRNHPTATYSTTYVADAIIVEQSSLLGVLTTAEITYNTIDGAFRGITLTNWQNAMLKVNYNEMILLQKNSGLAHYGVRFGNIIGGSPNEVLGNKVTGFGYSAANSSGIEFTNSKIQSVQCNTLINTYRGFLFSGSCTNTTTRRNTMENHHYGFMLDNSAVIGLQGSGTTPADNRWLGSTWSLTGTVGGNFKTYTSGTTNPNPNSLMYVRNSVSYNPNDSYDNAVGSVPYSNTVSPQTLVYVTNPPLATFCPTVQEPPMPTELMAPKPGLSFNELKSQTEDEIEAIALLTELKEKAFAAGLSEKDSTYLLELAISCPFVSGNTVYEAGTFFNLYFQTAEVFSYNCTEVSGNEDFIEASEQNMWVYPNPNNGTFNLKVDQLSDEDVLVRIKDMNGRVVHERIYKTQKQSIVIEVSLASGTYLVELESQKTSERWIEKIAIQR